MEIYYWKEGTDRRTGNRREELPGTRFAFCHLVSLHPESVKKRKEKKSIYVQENSGKDDYKHESSR